MGRNAAFKMRLSRKNRKWRDFANFDELGRFGPNGGDSQKKRAKTPQYSTTSRINKKSETRHGMKLTKGKYTGDTPRNDLRTAKP